MRGYPNWIFLFRTIFIVCGLFLKSLGVW